VDAFSAEISDSWDEDDCTGSVKPRMIDYCVAYDGDIDWELVLGSNYYDLLLIRNVYRSLSPKSPIGVTISRYRFNGSKYILHSGGK
jgi:hypothetical protein